MKRFPRGSEWRKWDLHVHPPGTRLNDGYGSGTAGPDWKRFCKIIHDSDVQAIGIADYFSLNGFFDFKANYDRLYKDSNKVFFPNLELRLEKALSKSGECVNIHLLFRPQLKSSEADKFLSRLDTGLHGKDDKTLTCAELETQKHFDSATVTEEGIAKAIEAVFGKKAVRQEHVIIIASAGSDGIRSGGRSKQRKDNLADRVDKFCDGLFGNPSNVDHFLDPHRLEAKDQKVAPKPVFAGCDAHNFKDLEEWLGSDVTGNNEKHVTWVKADLSFEGLQQTLIEPSERVRIRAAAPDKKEPYKIISRIKFAASATFPSAVEFNPGLNAVIGSRSSGKSALLAYVAHAVDPAYTVSQQVAASDLDESEVGPGASITWDDVKDLGYSVEWAAPSATTGQVIYIPQNSLYAISERPADITAKIRPAVFRMDPEFEETFRKTAMDVDKGNDAIRDAVGDWFELHDEIETLRGEIQGLGDRQAIVEQQTALKGEINRLRARSALTAEEVELYQQIVADLGRNDARLEEIEQEKRRLAPYVAASPTGGKYAATMKIAVSVTMDPSPASMPATLRDKLQGLLDSARNPLLVDVKASVVDYRAALDAEKILLTQASEKLRNDNSKLIEKSVANVQMDGLVRDLKEQGDTLAEIGKKETLSKNKAKKQSTLLASIRSEIEARDLLLAQLAESFNGSTHKLEDMMFTIEVEYDPTDVTRVSDGFNKHEISPYVVDQKRVDITKAMSEPDKFVAYVGSGKQKLKQGKSAAAETAAVLTLTKDVRFVASLEGDRIGGFEKSSMTPGKQALFALTLILAEAGAPWPLLIDQPEDDLDSRSVCDIIVTDLMRRKRERQVIMVSHNANLVIGADSEEIIVANRHGDDRRNRGCKTFAYLSGSLEHSKPKDPRETIVLESAGIREHACEILDGGAEAFQKRKDKYRI